MGRREDIRGFFRAEMEEGYLIDGIGDTESLVDAGLLDSLSILILLCHLTEQYGITPDEADLDIGLFETVAMLDEYIEARVASQPRSLCGG